MVTPGQFDDAEEKEVVESKTDESADQDEVELTWREAEERLFGDEDSIGLNNLVLLRRSTGESLPHLASQGFGYTHRPSQAMQGLWIRRGGVLIRVGVG